MMAGESATSSDTQRFSDRREEGWSGRTKIRDVENPNGRVLCNALRSMYHLVPNSQWTIISQRAGDVPEDIDYISALSRDTVFTGEAGCLYATWLTVDLCVGAEN